MSLKPQVDQCLDLKTRLTNASVMLENEQFQMSFFSAGRLFARKVPLRCEREAFCNIHLIAHCFNSSTIQTLVFKRPWHMPPSEGRLLDFGFQSSANFG